MAKIKILKLKNKKCLLFHGDSLSLIEMDENSLAEFNGYLNCKEDSFSSLKLSDEFQRYLKSIPLNRLENEDERMPQELRTLVLPISSECNLSCPYCFAKTSKGNMNFSDYTKEDIDSLLEFLNNKCDPTPHTLVFFGGEPLIRFDIIEHTVKKVKMYPKLKIDFSITTNGTLLNDKIIDFIKKNNIAILLSIDGMDNEFNYRKYRNGKSSVPRVLKNIDKLKKANVPFEIRSTLTSDNPYIVETFMFLEELDVPFLLAFAYESENKSHTELTKYDNKAIKRIKEAFDRLESYYEERIVNNKPIFNKLILQFAEILRTRSIQNYECGAGHLYHTIMSDGSLYSCPHLMNQDSCSLGKLKDWPLKNVDDYDFIPVKSNEMNECQDCWALNLCHGGCASQKHSMGKKANQAYLKGKCDLDRLMFEFLIKCYYEIVTH